MRDSKRRNVVFILSDDQGAWAMRCAGNSDIETPNLDYLASQGVRYDNFFCVCPVCSPARASIMTGLIPSQHGVHDWICSGNLDRSMLGEHEADKRFQKETTAIPYLDGMLTYTDILQKKGYRCALSGKWHLGDSMNPQHGFSKWFTIGRGGCGYYTPDVIENQRLYFESGYITDIITDKALEYMSELRKEDEPYYISIHYTAPHSPWEEAPHPGKYLDLYRDCGFHATPDLPLHPNQKPTAPSGTGERRKELLRGYYAAITAMDNNIGRIIDDLKSAGEWERTIVVFTSDNGMNMGHHGIWGKGNGTFPFNMYDTAVKVPFIIRVPDTQPQSHVSEAMHSHYDWIHTITELLEIDFQPERKMPGKSFAKELLGVQAAKEQGSVVVYDEYGANRMIRTKEWKYIRRYPYGEDELYHLTEDPGEQYNLIMDKQYAEIREQLNHQLSTWFYTYADPVVDGTRESVRGYGQMCRAGIYSEGKEPYCQSKQA